MSARAKAMQATASNTSRKTASSKPSSAALVSAITKSQLRQGGQHAGLGARQRTSDLRTKASAADRSRAGLDESKCTGELSDKTPEFVEEVRARVRAWEVAMFAANKRLYAISAQRRDAKQHEVIQELEREWLRARRSFTEQATRPSFDGNGRVLGQRP